MEKIIGLALLGPLALSGCIPSTPLYRPNEEVPSATLTIKNVSSAYLTPFIHLNSADCTGLEALKKEAFEPGESLTTKIPANQLVTVSSNYETSNYSGSQIITTSARVVETFIPKVANQYFYYMHRDPEHKRIQSIILEENRIPFPETGGRKIPVHQVKRIRKTSFFTGQQYCEPLSAEDKNKLGLK